MRKHLFLLLFCLVSFLLIHTAQAERVLKVAVRTDISGMSYYNSDSDSWSGFEVDLAAKLAAALKYDRVQYIGITASSR